MGNIIKFPAKIDDNIFEKEMRSVFLEAGVNETDSSNMAKEILRWYLELIEKTKIELNISFPESTDGELQNNIVESCDNALSGLSENIRKICDGLLLEKIRLESELYHAGNS